MIVRCIALRLLTDSPGPQVVKYTFEGPDVRISIDGDVGAFFLGNNYDVNTIEIGDDSNHDLTEIHG